jgi:hypothetical protein
VRLSKTQNALVCALAFAAVKLAIDLYRASYHGVGLHLPSVLVGMTVVTVSGTIGHVLGLMALGKPLRPRAAVFIAVVSYFAAISLAHLLSSVVASHWMFLALLTATAFVVTVWIGPRWDPPTG